MIILGCFFVIFGDSLQILIQCKKNSVNIHHIFVVSQKKSGFGQFGFEMTEGRVNNEGIFILGQLFYAEGI